MDGKYIQALKKKIDRPTHRSATVDKNATSEKEQKWPCPPV